MIPIRPAIKNPKTIPIIMAPIPVNKAFNPLAITDKMSIIIILFFYYKYPSE